MDRFPGNALSVLFSAVPLAVVALTLLLALSTHSRPQKKLSFLVSSLAFFSAFSSAIRPVAAIDVTAVSPVGAPQNAILNHNPLLAHDPVSTTAANATKPLRHHRHHVHHTHHKHDSDEIAKKLEDSLSSISRKVLAPTATPKPPKKAAAVASAPSDAPAPPSNAQSQPQPVPLNSQDDIYSNEYYDDSMRNVSELNFQKRAYTFSPIYQPAQTISTPVYNNDPFSVPISTAAPPSMFARKAHPLSPLDSWSSSGSPIPTNKFYTNMLLGDRTYPMYVQPYVMRWSTNTQYGMSVDRPLSPAYVYGPSNSYYYAQSWTKSIVIGATEFTSTSNMKLNARGFRDFSVQAYLVNPNTNGQIWFPVVQGMGFVTAIYYNLVPQFTTNLAFTSFSEMASPNSQSRKYQVFLSNGIRWFIYIKVSSGSVPTLSLNSAKTAITCSSRLYGGMIQVSEGPANIGNYFDYAAGRYQTDAYMSGTVSGSTTYYQVQYVAEGSSLYGMPLVYAAPHHRQNLINISSKKITPIALMSPTMGKMVGYISTVLQFSDTIPTGIGFLPYSQLTSSVKYRRSLDGEDVEPDEFPKERESDEEGELSDAAREDEFHLLRKRATSPYLSSGVATKITNIATSELTGEDWDSETDLDSAYYAGKILDKLAHIVFTAKYILNNDNLARTGLTILKSVYARWATNQQMYPLAYDTTWKGLVSTAGWSDSGADFGSTYYNDHHFHYGYLVHAAAIIGQLDKDIGGNTWIAANKNFVNSLVRDVANPSNNDKYFPRWRSFDWFAGHSWAKGLFTSYDGKDEESSSEDYHFAYGMKLWGRVIGDWAMEARGNIMLSVMRRSINSYMLYTSSNTVMPSAIIPNKVSGILFENKVAYTTYFGTNTEYIHGIHMLPVTSVSSYIRSPTFVGQEWSAKLASIAPSLNTGWKGILYLNRVLTDISSAYNFFNTDSYFSSSKYLDSGMSRTWSLAMCAYVGKY